LPRLDLVFGASGYIGSHLVPRLAETRRVRATSRHIEVLQARGWPAVELVTADALSPESLPAAMAGVDTLFYLVHSMAAGKSFAELDRQAAENVARAAAGAGVRRIVYLGGLVPQYPRSVHLRSRAETGDVLRAGAIPVTEIRAGMIIGPGSAAWEVMRDLVNHLPLMLTPRWVRSRSTPIALDDLLADLIAVADIPQATGRIYDTGGPDIVTYEQIMRTYGSLAGRRPRILPVPFLTPRLSSYWLRLVTSVPTPIARALIDGLAHDVIADDTALRRLVPRHTRNLEDSIRYAMDADRRHALTARWVEGSIACRNFRPEYSFYAKRAGGHAETMASREALWRVVSALGGDDGYYYANWLWHLRRVLDWLLGGPSYRRSRRDPVHLRVGDVVDSWRVIGAEPGERLTLLMEMKAPGAGVLELVIDEHEGHRRVNATAYWHPAGVWGLLYWYALLPAHLFLFAGFSRAMARRAESLSATGKKEGVHEDALAKSRHQSFRDWD